VQPRHTATKGAVQDRRLVVDSAAVPAQSRSILMVGPSATPSYEFSPEEEAKIARLAWRVRMWGMVALAFGIGGISLFALIWFLIAGRGSLHGGFLLTSFVAMAPVLVVNALIAFLYIGAGRALRRVVDTQTEDVPHLLDGLARLSGAFRIETILGSIGVVAGLIALIQMLAG
jgi:hypothetical protein